MKILVNAIAASQGGALSILKEFHNDLVKNKDRNEWFFLTSGNYIYEVDNISVIQLPNVKKNWMNRLLFDFHTNRRIINRIKPDVIFSLQNTIFINTKVPQVVYMHQAIPFQKEKKFSMFKKQECKFAIYQYIIGALIKYSIKKSKLTFVQSNWISEVIIKSLKVDNSKIVVAPPTVKVIETVVDKVKQDNVTNQFFYPAEPILYKNHDCIIKASEILDEKYNLNHSIKFTFNELEANKKKNIEYLGMIDRMKVFENYASHTLIFPSYIETFGLPLLEAKHSGGLILAAESNYAREVLKDYENAYFFDPFEPEELAYLMSRVIKKEIKKFEVNYSEVNINGWQLIREKINELSI